MSIDNNTIKNLNKLISYKTVNNNKPKEFVNCANYIINLLKNTGFKIKTKLNQKNKPLIVADLKKNHKSNFIFLIYGHYDVQDAGEKNYWQYPPFKLSINEERLFGRGICDSKGNIIANLLGIESFLKEKKNNLNFNIRYIIEGEEEIGSPFLKKNIKKIKKYLKDVNLCMFPGESSVRDDQENIIIPTGYKGCLLFKIKFFNKKKNSFHSSFGKLIENPAYLLIKFIYSLKEKFDNLKLYDIKNHYKKISSYEKKIIKIFPYKFNGKSVNYSLKKELFFKPVLNILDFSTSNFFLNEKITTSIPKEASVFIDIRLTPYLKTNIVLDLIKKFIKEFFLKNNIKTLNYKIEEKVKLEYAYSNFKKTEIDKIKKSFLRLNKKPNKIYFLPLAPGSGPQYYLCTQFNIPTFVAGIGYSKSFIHSFNENVRINDFLEHIEFVKNLLININKL